MDFEAGQLEPVTLGRAKSSKNNNPPIRWVSHIQISSSSPHVLLGGPLTVVSLQQPNTQLHCRFLAVFGGK